MDPFPGLTDDLQELNLDRPIKAAKVSRSNWFVHAPYGHLFISLAVRCMLACFWLVHVSLIVCCFAECGGIRAAYCRREIDWHWTSCVPAKVSGPCYSTHSVEVSAQSSSSLQWLLCCSDQISRSWSLLLIVFDCVQSYRNFPATEHWNNLVCVFTFVICIRLFVTHKVCVFVVCILL
jgi:hypothetical protein